MSGGAEHEERAYVYMVRCAGGQLYTGWTNDPGARLHAHKTGKGAKATRAMGAKRFAYLERCADKSDALRNGLRDVFAARAAADGHAVYPPAAAAISQAAATK